MTTQSSDTKRSKSGELTGRHVLLILIAFFGVIISVNALFITKAVSSFTGEDVKKSYLQGLDYNTTIQTRSAQATLGWNVAANVVEASDQEQRFIVRISDADNTPIRQLSITGKFKRPTDLAKDESVSFTERGNGIYEARVKLPKGQWRLQAIANSADNNFRFENQFVIS